MSLAPGAQASRNTAVVGSAQTVRPSATALFSVNSADRFRDYAEERSNLTSTPYDFVIRKNENLLSGFFSRIAVSEIVFPFSIPNISTSTTQINFTYGATTVLLTVDAGFYTPNTFASYFQTLLRNTSGILDLTFDYGLGRQPVFTYETGAVGTPIGFSPVVQSATFPYGSDRIQLFDMLGFKVGLNDVPTASQFSGESTFFQKVVYFDIVSSLLTGNQALKDATSAPIDRNVLCRVYLEDGVNQHLDADDPNFAPNGTQPFIIYRQFSTPKQIAWDGRQPISQLNFQVYDQDGYLLSSVPAGLIGTDTNWQMSLLVSEN